MQTSGVQRVLDAPGQRGSDNLFKSFTLISISSHLPTFFIFKNNIFGMPPYILNARCHKLFSLIFRPFKAFTYFFLEKWVVGCPHPGSRIVALPHAPLCTPLMQPSV